MMKRHVGLWVMLWMGVGGLVHAGRVISPVQVHDVVIHGNIEDDNIRFSMDLRIESGKHGQEMLLLRGDVVIQKISLREKQYRLRYDGERKAYFLMIRRAGDYKFQVQFVSRAQSDPEGAWRESEFFVPNAHMRKLAVVFDRKDLDVMFPHAMRFARSVLDHKPCVTALLGTGHPVVVRWKPGVKALDARLVLSSEVNTVVTVTHGALRLDNLFAFHIAQGKLQELEFDVPAGVDITRVSGAFIRDWRMEEGDRGRMLRVVLNRAQTVQYAVQIEGEMDLPALPSTFDLPVIQPRGGVRTNGHVAVGTDSAIHMVVRQTRGLSQIDKQAFPRIRLEEESPRGLPQAKAFYYLFATSPYGMRMALDDIIAVYDATGRIRADVREDDLVVDAEMELEVRDAPLRSVQVRFPSDFMIANLSGAMVEDYTVLPHASDSAWRAVTIHFQSPVLGRTVFTMRLEQGRSPINQSRTIAGIGIAGARHQRGHLVIAVEDGVALHTPRTDHLREVHTGSVPMRAASAQFAYRFRDTDWRLRIMAAKKTPGIRAESFHLISLGDEIVYGSVVVNYSISGAPVDELRFRISGAYQSLEFVGNDVRRWHEENGVWIVKLHRKVVGDYNLGVMYTRRYDDGGEFLVGRVSLDGVETQTGYITISSHQNITVAIPPALPGGILAIEREEIPSHYRLMINAPILTCFKYHKLPHEVRVKVDTYDRNALLPVIIEVMDIQSDLEVRKTGAIESITRIQYKVKNASSQFLTLQLPERAHLWATHLVVRGPDGVQRRERVLASANRGRLLIPLKRLRNPNEPLTVELVYGQVHGRSAGDVLKLLAPLSEVKSTFASWRVRVPERWSMRQAEGGNMVAPASWRRGNRLAGLMQGVVAGWVWALPAWLEASSLRLLLAACAVTLFLVFALRRKATRRTAMAMLLLLCVVHGFMGTLSPDFSDAVRTDRVSSVTYTQALSLADHSPLSIAFSVLPVWRMHVHAPGMVTGCGIMILAGLLAVRFRMARPVSIMFGLCALAYVLGMFRPLSLPLAHVFSWGMPLCVLGRLVLTGLPVPGVPAVRAARIASCVLCLAILPSVSARASEQSETSVEPFFSRDVFCRLDVEQDSMKVDLKIVADVEKPVTIPIIGTHAVLLDAGKSWKYAGMKEEHGRYVIGIDKRGEYEFHVSFLLPLAAPSEDRIRRFAMPLPPALSNQVELFVQEPGLHIFSPNAVRLIQEGGARYSRARAIFPPGDGVCLTWQPGSRQRDKEQVVFYTDVVSMVKFDAGLVEGHHRIHFQIAQGELRDLRLHVPDNVTVTAMEGEALGAWRFHPASHEVEMKFAGAISGVYALKLVTQIVQNQLPYHVALGGIHVAGSARHRGILGLAASDTVQIAVSDHPQPMNVDDFARQAGGLLRDGACMLHPEAIRHAYRTLGGKGRVRVRVFAVHPEMRSFEKADFTVQDDRMVYNGEFGVVVSKAGVFSVDLSIPEGYDIDALDGRGVSHWDEQMQEQRHDVRVHFQKKFLGEAVLKLTISRAVGSLPARLPVPRIRLVDSVKHHGRMIVSSDRGVRLLVAGREGISELNPRDLGVYHKGAMAFRLLRPDWNLSLQTEVVRPRIHVDFLHVAEVSEGLLHHKHYLRYRFHNAGVKMLHLQLPQHILGLSITGPGIAHMKEIQPGRWQVELSSKWFDRIYPLTLKYDTRFDLEDGALRMLPVKALGVDMQTGHVVVKAVSKMAVTPRDVGRMLQPAEARGIQGVFGAGELSDAVFCFRSTTADYVLAFHAMRHDTADSLDAEVLKTDITTVVNERGETINHVHLRLQVSGRRYLEVLLPDRSSVWSVMVNQRFTMPSRLQDHAAGGRILIPLAQSASGELPVDVELIYVHDCRHAWTDGRLDFDGPQFDLPLKDIAWRFYLPDGYLYHGFDGTMSVNDQDAHRRIRRHFDLATYVERIRRENLKNEKKAIEYQRKGKYWAGQGKQYQAKQALENAYHYSFSNEALNEDALVQLHSLSRQQAIVGLIGRRNFLRKQHQSGGGAQRRHADNGMPTHFRMEDAERIRNSLAKDDSANIEMITEKLIQAQHAAAGHFLQLLIHMPLHGRLLSFYRPLQVEAHTEMKVHFAARPESGVRAWKDAAWTACAGAMVLWMLCAMKITGGRPGGSAQRQGRAADARISCPDGGDHEPEIVIEEDDAHRS